MSLTAHILFERPTTLPSGRRRRHMMEDGRRIDPDAPRQPTHTNVLTALRNTEAVHAAVSAGCDTVTSISTHTGLSLSTVKKALSRLEGWPGGARVSRDRRETTHRFEVSA